MNTIGNIDISDIAIQVQATFHHHWAAGEKMHHNPAQHSHIMQQGQLWFVQKGHINVHATGKKWSVKKGEAMFLPVSLERDITTPQGASWLSLRLWVSVFGQFGILGNITKPIQWKPDAQESLLLESWMEQIFHNHRCKEAHSLLLIHGLGQAIFGLCWPRISSVSLLTAARAELPEWLAETLRRISDYPAQSVADLAHEAGFSPAQFRRSFHRYVGSSPQDYLKTKRLEAARHYLEHTDLTVSSIANQTGFKNAGYFSQVFKKAYGFSPTDYRALQHFPK